MPEQNSTDDQIEQVEPPCQDHQRLCGTFVLRRSLAEMTEEDREAFLENLESLGMSRII